MEYDMFCIDITSYQKAEQKNWK